MIRNGIEYLDEDLETFPDGSVHDAVLARDTEIQGLPCAGKHDVVFFPNGRLRLAWLSRRTLVGDVACSSGLVYLYENGGILNTKMAASQRFSTVIVSAGSRVTLGENGNLLEYCCKLSEDQKVGGFPCAAEFNIWFYPSGRLSMAVLASASVVDGQEFSRGTELFLNENGQVLEFYQVDIDSGHRYKQSVFGVYRAPFG